MCSNVIPSAPQEESGLYPQLPQHDFRMQKANEVSGSLNAEVAHHWTVAKKYKRARKAANWSAAGCSMFSTDVTNTGNGKRGTGNGERGTGNGEWGTGNGERGTENGERGTGNGSLGTSIQR